MEYFKDPAEKIGHLKQFSAGHKAARVNTVCDYVLINNTIDLKSYAGVKKFTEESCRQSNNLGDQGDLFLPSLGQFPCNEKPNLYQIIADVGPL